MSLLTAIEDITTLRGPIWTEVLMAKRQAKSKSGITLEVLFDGEKISPDKMPLRLIADSLAAVQRLASGLDPDVVTQLPENESLGLVGVKRGSAIYQCVAHNPRGAIEHLRLAGELIRRPEVVPDQPVDFVLNPLHVLSRTATALECQIIVREAGKTGRALAQFDGEVYERLAKHLLVSGETTITGRVMRAGGATDEKCALRVEGRTKLLFCEVETRELAKKLGENLYEDVAARGIARWLQHTWKLFAFRILGVQVAKKGSLLESFKALHAAGGKAWDAVADPEALVREFHT